MSVDFPALRFDLGDEIEMLRDSVRRFCRDEVAPRARAIDRDNAFPADLWPKLGALGALGVTADPAFGGAGLGYLAHCVAMEEISRAAAPVGLSYGAHSNLCVNQIARHGSEEQKRKYLPALCAGERVGALAISEPGAGSDVAGMALRAERRDGGWVLNGAKTWITNAPDAGTIVAYARSADGPDGGGEFTAFIVERGFEGLAAGPKLDKLGMRGSNTGELAFSDCRVPEGNVLGGEGRGMAVLMSGLDLERVVLAAGPVGIMQACLDTALPYLHERRQFGRPIGEFQLMRAKLADMYTALSAARAYLYAVAAACDRGEVSRQDCAAVILFAAERATECALQTVQALGANGYTEDYPAGRLLRDAKLYEIGAGTSEIRRLLIGRELLRGTA